MKEQIAVLVNLQEVDSESECIRRRLDAIPEKLDALDSELDRCQNDLAETEAALEALTKQYRSYDSDVRIRRDGIQKSQARLMSVKSNKEYHAILKEVEEHEKKNDDIETEMLDLLDRIEVSEEAVKEKKKVLLVAKKKIDVEKAQCLQVGEENKKRLKELETRREEVLGDIDSGLMSRFESVRKIVSGPTIVPSVKSVCEGCNMNIPPQMHIDLKQSDDLNFCPFCHRIIYWKAAEVENELNAKK